MWGGILVTFLRSLFIQVAASAPQPEEGLFTVGPYMAKLLAVVALYETCLGSVCLIVDDDIDEAGQFEYFPILLVVDERHQQ